MGSSIRAYKIPDGVKECVSSEVGIWDRHLVPWVGRAGSLAQRASSKSKFPSQ